MARNRKLQRTTDQRLALLRTQLSSFLLNGQIETTLAKAKELKSQADSIIALAIKEKDNFDLVDVKVVKAKLDDKGRKVTEKVTSKNGKEYLRVVKEVKTEQRKKDRPSRLNARRKMMTKINKLKDSKGNTIDLTTKLFEEIAPKYADRVGGYTRLVKTGPRKGDAAEMAILQLL